MSDRRPSISMSEKLFRIFYIILDLSVRLNKVLTDCDGEIGNGLCRSTPSSWAFVIQFAGRNFLIFISIPLKEIISIIRLKAVKDSH